MRGAGWARPALRVLAALAVALGPLGCAFGPRPAWEQPPPPVRTGPVVDAARLHRGRLANGMELLLFQDDRLPVVSFGMVARRGAGSEPASRAGLATFTAGLLERGAGDRDALALARVVDDLGASFGASASWDRTTVQLSGLSRDLDALWGVLTDVVLRPRFDPAEAEKVRAELLAQLEKAKDDPRSLASDALLRTLYDGHRYGLPLGGARASVASLGPDDARAFHGSVFTPEDTILFAAGDVDWERLRALAEASFGSWSGGATPAAASPPPDPTPPARRVVVVDRPDLVQAQILLGHEGIARTQPDRVPIGLMARVLGQGGFSSRLMDRVRKDAGLTYGIYCAFSMRRQPGPFLVSTFTRVDAAGQVVGMVLEELERMKTEPATPDELDSVKRESAAGFVLGLETASDVVAALVDLDVHGLPADSLDTYRARVAAQGAEDLAEAARQRLHPDRIAIVAVGPADQLAPALERFGPVEIVHP